MRPLQDFLTQIEIEVLNGCSQHIFPVKAYAVDKPVDSRRRKSTLKNELRMSNCHSCDYIFVNKNTVCLLEDSNLKKKKESLENEFLCFRESIPEKETRKNFLEKIAEQAIDTIKNEQVLKAYASLLLLNRLVSENNGAKKLMRNKEISFVVIINDIHIRQNPEFRAFNNLRSNIKSSIGELVPKVWVLPLKEARKLLLKYNHPDLRPKSATLTTTVLFLLTRLRKVFSNIIRPISP